MAENPQAFPLPAMHLEDGRGYAGQPGMTLRDWFAGQALGGMMGHQNADFSPLGRNGKTPCVPLFVEDAYALADAMLAERAKP